MAASDDHSRIRSRRPIGPQRTERRIERYPSRRRRGQGGCTDRNVSGAAGTAAHSSARQGLGALPGEDRAVQARAAGLADRGGNGSPRGSASAAASTATRLLPAAPRPARQASSGPILARRRARSRWAARHRRPGRAVCTKPTISSSCLGPQHRAGRRLDDAAARARRPVGRGEERPLARPRPVRSPRSARRAPRSSSGSARQPVDQAKASRPVSDRLREQPPHERGVRDPEAAHRAARTAPPRARASDRRPR